MVSNSFIIALGENRLNICKRVSEFLAIPDRPGFLVTGFLAACSTLAGKGFSLHSKSESLESFSSNSSIHFVQELSFDVIFKPKKIKIQS